jgi:hypothetical protein
VEAWAVVVVLDVADPGEVLSEETEVWVDVPVAVEDAEVAVPRIPPSKKAEPRKATTKIARTAPTATALLIFSCPWSRCDY